MRNVGNHISYGAVDIRNRIGLWTFTNVRTTKLQQSISFFPTNFMCAYYDHTSPTQDDEILLATLYINLRVNNNEVTPLSWVWTSSGKNNA